MSRRASNLVRTMGVLLVLGLVATIGFRVTRAEPAQTTESLKGKAAPDFTLKTVDGKEVTLSKLKGSVVLVDFWATWCGPCRMSLPHVQAISQDAARQKDGLVVLAVNFKEEAAKINDFLKDNKYSFTVPMDSTGATLENYHVEGIPTTVIIGRDGAVATVFVGVTPPEELDKAVTEALKAK